MKKLMACMLTGALAFSAIPMTGDTVQAETAKAESQITQFMDCIEPMPIIGSLSEDCWGAADVGARDQDNGLEDRDLKNYCYWDGAIIKEEETGKYYMFASRWNQAGGHWGQDGIPGWQGSQAIYSVSDNLYGPYEDLGPIWPEWCEGAGHNVFPFKLSTEDVLYEQGYRYAISISDTGMHGDTANGTIHISKSLKGPWELIENGNAGKLKAEGSFNLSNISIMVRPDGTYEATNRNGDLAVADSVAGIWKVKENSLWTKIPEMDSKNVEDPVIWYADGLYHIVANKWDTRMAYYLTSEDGITNWRRHPGTAYTPGKGCLIYEDGTVNDWTKIERPNIYVENGKIVAMTFAVIDVQKEEDFGNDQHGSKVIVVPCSSEKIRELDAKPNPLENRKGLLPIADTTAQTWDSEVRKNYGAEKFLQIQKDPNYLNYGKDCLGGGTRPDQWYDNKISYLKFDISEEAKAEEIESASLSLIYQNRADGNAETTGIQAVLCDSNWLEGNGNESENGNQADAGTLTWENQPQLIYDANDIENTTALSEEFNIADLKRVVEIDVTDIVKKFLEEHPGENTVSFALNATTTGSRFRIASRESGEQFAPRLVIHTKKAEENQDQAAADVVKKLISELGPVSYTKESREKIKAARTAYEALTETQQSLVDNVDVLAAAEATYRKLEEDSLIAEEKKKQDQAAANAVKKLIFEIGTVRYTAESKARIDKAISAYQVLSEQQKAFVDNYSLAVKASAEYRKMESTVQRTRVQKVTLKSAKSKKQQIRLVWKKVRGASGYEVQYSTDKKFRRGKKKSVSKTTLQIKKLKRKKVYSVRVRAYKRVYGKKIYGAYSKIRKVKIR